LALLAFGTYTEKIYSLIGNIIAGLFCYVFRDVFYRVRLRINDVSAYGTDNMRMGVRSVPIITIAGIRKAQFQYFVQLLKERNGFVKGCKTGCWKIRFYLFKNLFHIRVAVTDCEYFQDSQTLWGNPEFLLPQFGKHLIKTKFRISQNSYPH
jgi:hypothetical protein